MEIISLKEFYEREENESKNISLYLSYLSGIKEELNKRLDDALLLSLSESITNDIRNQISLIEGLENLINNSCKDLIASSVDDLSVEDINLLCSKYLSIYLEKQKELQTQLDAKKQEKEDQKEKFYLLGYKDEFYEAKDTEVFFNDLVSAADYTKYLITSDMNNVELEELFSLIPSIVSYSSQLADMIIKLRNIYEVTKSDETLNEVVDSFLSENGMIKVIEGSSIEYCTGILRDLQKYVKLNTAFFKGLPETLQEQISAENLQTGAMYDSVLLKIIPTVKFNADGIYDFLLKIYTDYKENGKVIIPEDLYDKSLEDSIKDLEEQILAIGKDIETLRSNDIEALVKFIKDNIQACKIDFLSIEASKDNLKYDIVETDISPKVEELENNISELNNIADYIDKILSNLNDYDYLMMQTLGIVGDEADIFPYYDAERKRLKQYEVLIPTISSLNKIKEKINKINNSHNVIKNISGINQRKKAELMEEYQERCQKCYEELDSLGLLRVEVVDPSSENKSQTLDKPLNFEEIFKSTTVADYQEIIQKYAEEIVKLHPFRLNILSLKEVCNLFDNSTYYTKLLFNVWKDNDGLLEFGISSHLDNRSISQEMIVYLLGELYASHKEKTLTNKLAEIKEKILKFQGELEVLKKLLDKTDSPSVDATVEDVNEFDESVESMEETKKQTL